jgi:hypothetical protein
MRGCGSNPARVGELVVVQRVLRLRLLRVVWLWRSLSCVASVAPRVTGLRDWFGQPCRTFAEVWWVLGYEGASAAAQVAGKASVFCSDTGWRIVWDGGPRCVRLVGRARWLVCPFAEGRRSGLSL